MLSAPAQYQTVAAQVPVPALDLPLLLVVNQGDANLSIVDPTIDREVATVLEAVPSTIGHEVAASPNGRYAYVPLYSDTGVGKPGTDGRFMLVIDLRSRSVVDRVDFGHGVRPHCVLFNRRDGMLYITTEIDRSVTIVNPKTLQVAGTIPTGQDESHMLAISHDGRRGYTANVGPGTVSVLDLVKRKLLATIPIAKNAQRISISNDDSMVFTADQTAPRLAVIDTASNKLRQWIPLPSVGYGSVSTPDGRFLLITQPTTGELAVLSLESMQVVRTVKVGPRPQEVVLTKDGKTAYVSCFGGSEVVAIKIPSWDVQGTIKVGRQADGMVWVEKLAE